MAAIVSHTMRSKGGGTVTLEKLSKLKAIRAFCTECQGWEEDPNNCTDLLCPLYPWRGRVQFTSKSPQDVQGTPKTILKTC
jgi:hypothetical protein